MHRHETIEKFNSCFAHSYFRGKSRMFVRYWKLSIICAAKKKSGVYTLWKSFTSFLLLSERRWFMKCLGNHNDNEELKENIW